MSKSGVIKRKGCDFFLKVQMEKWESGAKEHCLGRINIKTARFSITSLIFPGGKAKVGYLGDILAYQLQKKNNVDYKQKWYIGYNCVAKTEIVLKQLIKRRPSEFVFYKWQLINGVAPLSHTTAAVALCFPFFPSFLERVSCRRARKQFFILIKDPSH